MSSLGKPNGLFIGPEFQTETLPNFEKPGTLDFTARARFFKT
jgi:hypothetical protein